ncbi:MAG: hypothetical protein IPL79_10215 [Myxococcales bacterium]|nr:hypothetical protein [Myxococcales bacterium]
MFGYSISWDKPWSKLGVPHLVGLALFALFIASYATDADPWVPILDSANLAFHEAGHPFYAAFGDTMGWLGGTIGQLTFPFIGMLVFLYRKHAASLAMCALWYFQNFFNIARYVADAQVQELPLVGGGQHDWTYLLTKWGVLHKEMQIASNLRLVAWLGFFAVAVFLAWRMVAQRQDESVRRPRPSRPPRTAHHCPTRGRASPSVPLNQWWLARRPAWRCPSRARSHPKP